MLAVDEQPVATSTEFRDYISKRPGERVILTLHAADGEAHVAVTVRAEQEGRAPWDESESSCGAPSSNASDLSPPLDVQWRDLEHVSAHREHAVEHDHGARLGEDQRPDHGSIRRRNPRVIAAVPDVLAIVSISLGVLNLCRFRSWMGGRCCFR